MQEQEFSQKTRQLIDNLKAICARYGLGNDGNEYKIITQVFLYKFMNDKFGYEIKKLRPDFANDPELSWEQKLEQLSENDYEMLTLMLGANNATLKPYHLISSLANRQNQEQFAKIFDDTMRDIAILNNDIFAVKTESGTKIQLFEDITPYIVDTGKRDAFARAIINQLVDVNFDQIFDQKFDFFSTIFEYLIKDYNKDGGGKYAEYYTPHAVAKIIAEIMVESDTSNARVYDPSAGSGTLLMNMAHSIGEDKCTIYSQDISQKSSSMLRLNLILNNLVHSIHNITQGDTIKDPAHRGRDGQLKKFDFIVSNPPFKLDFSDVRESLDTKENQTRFFAGIPNVPKAKKDSMAIYLLFIQHIMVSLSPRGRGAIVVPTGFITAQTGIEKKIRETMVEQGILKGVVSMPSNIFATTGTNVSILFLDKANQNGKVVLMDASKLGTTVKDGKNQKTVLSPQEESLIIQTFRNQETIEDFSVVLDYAQIKDKNYSFSAGQYFDIKIEYTDITTEDFQAKMDTFQTNLSQYFQESKQLEGQIFQNLNSLKYNKE
jgi:type I restriction enzyme M protein